MDSVLNNVITIQVTEQQLQIIGEALSQLPWKVSNSIIMELNKQINAVKETKPEAKE